MANQKNTEDLIDFAFWWRTILKHWWWFAISMLVAAIGAVLYVKTHSPEYMVRANVLVIDDNSARFTAMSGIDDLFGSRANAEDEQFVIASHSVLRDVARKLGVNQVHMVKTGLLRKTLAYPEYPVTVYPAAGILDTLRTGILFKISVEDGKADVEAKADRNVIAEVEDAKLPVTLKTAYGTYVVDTTKYCPKNEKVKTDIYIQGYDDTAEELSEMISFDKATKKSSIIELFIKTSNTAYGAAILDEAIRQYNKRALEQRNFQGQKTAEFIDSRLALISGDLANAEKNIQEYKQDRGLVDVGAEATYNMSKRGSSEAALVTAQTNYEMLKFTRDFITNPQNQYELIPGNDLTGASAGAINTYNNLILRRMNLLKNARSGNVALKNVEEQIDAMRGSINSSLETALQTARIAVDEARQQVAVAQNRLGDIPAQEREFLDLKRQQEVKQQLYLFLLQRREETAMLLANSMPKGQIVDEAYSLSDPVSMSKKMIVLIFGLLGLIIPLVILYIKVLLHNKFENSDALRRMTDAPILGEVCISRSEDNLVVGPEETSSVAELFRALRSNLEFMLKGESDKVILVTSTRSGEGKSFVSLNLAATIGFVDKRVLLIGMDIRNPRLAEYLGMPNANGLTTYLSRPSTTVESIIQHYDRATNLDVIVAGPVPPNPGELLTSPRLKTLLDSLREQYDYIVIDSAPVGMVSDTFNLASLADTTVYVTRADYTTKSDIRFLNTIIDEDRLHSVSVVVNGTTAKRRYGYGYSHSK